LHTPQGILTFWFGEDFYTSGTISKEHRLRWWKKDPTFDETIRKQFGPMIEAAKNGDYDQWRETAKGSLALILLFDQFTRNCYRGTAAMYAYDTYAL